MTGNRHITYSTGQNKTNNAHEGGKKPKRPAKTDQRFRMVVVVACTQRPAPKKDTDTAAARLPSPRSWKSEPICPKDQACPYASRLDAQPRKCGLVDGRAKNVAEYAWFIWGIDMINQGETTHGTPLLTFIKRLCLRVP